jgi:hypothetical protein
MPEPSAQPATDPATGPATDPGADADLAPDVPTSPETVEQGQGDGLISGIDVSHHNGDIDYEKVRAAGNEFVFAKATQDNDFIDPMFVINMARARAAGLAAGGYHFFDYTLDGRDQADHFIDRLELAGALDGALPPVVDIECWAPIGSSCGGRSSATRRASRTCRSGRPAGVARHRHRSPRAGTTGTSGRQGWGACPVSGGWTPTSSVGMPTS